MRPNRNASTPRLPPTEVPLVWKRTRPLVAFYAAAPRKSRHTAGSRPVRPIRCPQIKRAACGVVVSRGATERSNGRALNGGGLQDPDRGAAEEGSQGEDVHKLLGEKLTASRRSGRAG